MEDDAIGGDVAVGCTATSACRVATTVGKLSVERETSAFGSATVGVGATLCSPISGVCDMLSWITTVAGLGAVRAVFKPTTEQPPICQKSSNNKPARRQPVACGLRGKRGRRLISRCAGDIRFLKSIITLTDGRKAGGRETLRRTKAPPPTAHDRDICPSLVSPASYRHPQSIARAGKLFQESRLIPSPRRDCNLCGDGHI